MPLTTIWKRLNRPSGNNNQLPSNLRRYFVVGLGLGTGTGFGIYLAKKLTENHYRQEFVVALKNASHEFKELRSSVMIQCEKTVSALTNDRVKKLYRGLRKQDVANDTTVSDLPGADQDQTFDERSSRDGSRLQTNRLMKRCDNLAGKNTVPDNDEEMRILEELLANNPNDVEVLWRFARAHRNKAGLCSERGDEEAKLNATYKGMKFVRKALEIDENHAEAHKWYAVLLGYACGMASLAEKTVLVPRYAKHLSKALELKPDDPILYYLMGRWRFEIISLSWWQRQTVFLLTGKSPTSSIEDALSSFNQAEELNPGVFKSNMLYIAKCYQNLGDMEKAREWAEKAFLIPVKDDEDKKAHEEASAILAELDRRNFEDSIC